MELRSCITNNKMFVYIMLNNFSCILMLCALLQVDFTDADKIEIVRGMTQGLAYLHSMNVVHCDLKTQNVLLINVPGLEQTDKNETVLAKITDFGLSKMKSDMVTSSSISTVQIGTPRYTAPEIFQGKILTLEEQKKSDIYSMGLLIWELAVEEIPFEDLNQDQLRVQVGEKGLKPTEEGNLKLDIKLKTFLDSCLNFIPDQRPDAKFVAGVASNLTALLVEGEE
jgi:serine/threonine protein kinase